MSSPCAMASLWHSGSQAPQLMHSSVMMVATRSPCRRGYVARGQAVCRSEIRLYARRLLSDPDRLGVGELADALFRELAAIARRLDAAEGQPRVALHHAIDEDLARLQLVDEAVDLLRILGERRGPEAELRVVRQRDGLVEVPGADHRRDRAEDLFIPHFRASGLEPHGGLEEEAGTVDAAASAGEIRSLFAGAAHLLLDVLEDLFRGERTDVRRVVLRVADLEGAHALDESLLELGGDLLVHDEPLGRDAALPGVLHARRHGDLRCLVEIRAGENDERIAAAQLEDRLLELRARSRRDAAARSVAAGQRRRGDTRGLDDLLHPLAPDQQRLEATFRVAGLAEDLLDR